MKKLFILSLLSAFSFADCTYFQKFLDQGVPKKPLKQALNFLEENINFFKNKNYISIIDYSMSSTEKRYFLLNMRNGEVSRYKVSHGSGKINGYAYGDPDHDGMLDKCKHSESIITKAGKGYHNRWAMTRPGFFTTLYEANSWAHDPTNSNARSSWPMFSTNPRLNKLLLDGISPGINDLALNHGVVMHEAWYNKNEIMGRSFGCPAFKPNVGRIVSKKIKNGSLVYAYVPQCKSDYIEITSRLSHWQETCK